MKPRIPSPVRTNSARRQSTPDRRFTPKLSVAIVYTAALPRHVPAVDRLAAGIRLLPARTYMRTRHTTMTARVIFAPSRIPLRYDGGAPQGGQPQRTATRDTC